MKQNHEQKPSEMRGTELEQCVPECLLAIAKDDRYVEDCEALLLRALLPFFESQDVERFDRTARLMSSFLYAVLVLARKKRTAGMQVCGLEFDDVLPRWKLVLGALVSATSVYEIRRAAASITDHRANEYLTGSHRREPGYSHARAAGVGKVD